MGAVAQVHGMGIRPPERKNFFTKRVFGIPHFATVALLMLATVALGSGIAIVGNMFRWESWRDVPVERRKGVNEPIVYHIEDVAPLSQETLAWLRESSQYIDLHCPPTANGNRSVGSGPARPDASFGSPDARGVDPR